MEIPGVQSHLAPRHTNVVLGGCEQSLRNTTQKMTYIPSRPSSEKSIIDMRGICNVVVYINLKSSLYNKAHNVRLPGIALMGEIVRSLKMQGLCVTVKSCTPDRDSLSSRSGNRIIKMGQSPNSYDCHLPFHANNLRKGFRTRINSKSRALDRFSKMKFRVIRHFQRRLKCTSD